MDLVAEAQRWGYIVLMMLGAVLIAHNLMKERKG